MTFKPAPPPDDDNSGEAILRVAIGLLVLIGLLLLEAKFHFFLPK